MILFCVKELLEKNKMSRYKLRQYSGMTFERVNQFYFSTAKSIKVEELETLCKIFDCTPGDIVKYKKNSVGQ